MNEEEIGKRIKEIRQEKKFTQKQLSELSQIDATSISRYETGAQIPNLNTLVYIALALDTSLDYLVFGDKTDIKIQKKIQTSCEEKIFENIAFLLENQIMICDDDNQGYADIEISKQYKAYHMFILKYNKLKDFKNLIGISYDNAKIELIKSFAKELEKEKELDNLPF